MENKKNLKPHNLPLVAITLGLLALVYVLQRLDYLNFVMGVLGLSSADPTTTFAVNRTIRLLLNDAICFFLIYGLFGERRYLRIAFYVFCFEFFLLLPVYLVIKLGLEGPSEISSPLLSPIHRLIVNPMLMLLLIIAFYYQQFLQLRRS